MQIQILNVTATNPTNSAGKPYSKLEIAFKNLTFQGKVEGKQLMGFGATKAAHDTLINAQPGETFEIEVKKNDRGYNDWVNAVKPNGAAPAPTNVSTAYAPNSAYPPKAPGTQTTTASPKSTYETPEERAKKQVYIVRQSSLSNAIDLLSVGSKASPDVDKVLEVASRFESFVFGDSTKDNTAVAESFFPNSPKPTNPDLADDDIPF